MRATFWGLPARRRMACRRARWAATGALRPLLSEVHQKGLCCGLDLSVGVDVGGGLGEADLELTPGGAAAGALPQVVAEQQRVPGGERSQPPGSGCSPTGPRWVVRRPAWGRWPPRAFRCDSRARDVRGSLRRRALGSRCRPGSGRDPWRRCSPRGQARHGRGPDVVHVSRFRNERTETGHELDPLGRPVILVLQHTNAIGRRFIGERHGCSVPEVHTPADAKTDLARRARPYAVLAVACSVRLRRMAEAQLHLALRRFDWRCLN